MTVSTKISPVEAEFGEPTKVTGTVLEDGVPAAGRAVQLEGKGYPFSGAAEVLATTTTADDGTFVFSEKLDGNTVLPGDHARRRVAAQARLRVPGVQTLVPRSRRA